jgi:hypothetical protein
MNFEDVLINARYQLTVHQENRKTAAIGALLGTIPP